MANTVTLSCSGCCSQERCEDLGGYYTNQPSCMTGMHASQTTVTSVATNKTYTCWECVLDGTLSATCADFGEYDYDMSNPAYQQGGNCYYQAVKHWNGDMAPNGKIVNGVITCSNCLPGPIEYATCADLGTGWVPVTSDNGPGKCDSSASYVSYVGGATIGNKISPPSGLYCTTCSPNNTTQVCVTVNGSANKSIPETSVDVSPCKDFETWYSDTVPAGQGGFYTCVGYVDDMGSLVGYGQINDIGGGGGGPCAGTLAEETVYMALRSGDKVECRAKSWGGRIACNFKCCKDNTI